MNVLFVYYGVLMSLSFQVSDVSSATDTISTNRPLSGFRTIISSGDIFELGIFNPSPGNNSTYAFYIGMWYKQVSTRTIVWVVNRESPVLDSDDCSSCLLKISDGNLILSHNFTDKKIWSTGVNSSRSKDVQAVLLDNGNLVLKDGPTSSADVLWQSFDYPTDTWLPDAKINLGRQLLTSWKSLTDPSPSQYSLEVDQNTKNSLITVWNGSKPYWSSTWPWDHHRDLKNATGLSFEFNMDESYVTYTVENRRVNTTTYTYRLVMDASGQFKLYSSSRPESFNLLSSFRSYRCEVYNYCGKFGICNETDEIRPCRCVPGFIRSIFEEDSYYYSGGCVRKTRLECGKGNFLGLENVTLPSDPTTLILKASHVRTCDSVCLANCSCVAYANDGSKCLMWTRDVFNLQQFEVQHLEADGSIGQKNFLRLAASEFSPTASNISTATSNISTATSNQGKRKLTKGRSIVLLAVLSSFVVAAAFFIGLYCCIFSRTKRKRAERDEKQSRELLEGGIMDDDGENMCYLNLHDIMAATNAFSEENKLGEGGFGPVYKGKLPNGMDVAIKRLSKKSNQGLTEFKNEVVLIIKLQHKNLVRLLGYCVEGDEKLLIYEYMSNKSLDVLLFDSSKCRELDWEKRMKIVNGTTRGLQYLHEDSRLRIIHRDLKASNILLDDEMNPKISDFGTSRIFGCKQIDDSTQRIVGTFGYMSPEYALNGLISEKSDIYSFGVLLLEIVSGKKATRFIHNDRKHSLIAYAWESWCETKGMSIIDEALSGSYSLKEVIRCIHIALLCVQDHPTDRPTISQIIYMLSNDNNLPIPKQPTFSNVLNGDQQQLASSDYEATQTEIEAR